MRFQIRPPLGVLALLLLASVSAVAQPTGDARQRMWPAPTAEDWKKPVLIQWQRTWEDALQVSRETGKPIMIAVNMDGEIASEHYAGIRYRSPEIAALFDPYVSVIASTYRHTPRDFDEQGRRVPCPRFGTVTCGEHIQIEPLLFDKYFEGQRVAPRHIMIELDGSETYDVYYAFDTDSVFKAIKDGVAGRVVSPAPVVRGDRSILERVASKDSSDRDAVEAAYRSGDAALKRAIVEAAGKEGGEAPLDVLRLAIFDLDLDLAAKARSVLAKSTQEGAVDLIAETLRAPLEQAEQERLIGALDRLGGKSNRAGRIAVVYRGLGTASKNVDLEGWNRVIQRLEAEDQEAEVDREAIAETIARAEQKQTAPELLDLAESFMRRSQDSLALDGSPTRTSRALMSDAADNARKAEALGASGWRVHTVLALAALDAGDATEAHRRAELAVSDLPENPIGRETMLVIALFAEKRHGAIVAAVKARKKWEGSLLSDMHAAHRLLLAHPDGTASQAVSHYDFLRWLDARAQAPSFLDEALARFPTDPGLHQRFRRQTMRDSGPRGLVQAYDRWIAKPETPPSITWFAGLANFQVAEMHRRRARLDRARERYDASRKLFDRAAEEAPEYRDNSDWYVVLVLAAHARLAYEAGDFDAATLRVVEALEYRPDYARARDGLNFSPVDTAKILVTTMRDGGKHAASLERLEKTLKALPPRMLELPEFERGGRPPSQNGNRPAPRRRNPGGGE